MAGDVAGHVEDTRLAEALSERYVAYAMSTITSRSLPDVRDGLKPVHRRLLYAMQQLKLDPSSGFKKCARVVGDVIGKFHPHGDASVYDALVRLAQDFAVRYPLVEGQGNFGSVDGDGAAAMRYTESRLTETARIMLDGINDNAVDFRPTYDNEDHEPLVLPGLFPNLLANGAAGIAVGMATNIPPHNAAEIYRAARLLIDKPESETKALLEVMPGPDFPTGGLLVEDRASVLKAYETGRGTFRTRAKWTVEKGRAGTWVIIVTEIPYQIQKSKLIEHIASAMEQRKLPLLSDVRDESTTDIRLVLEPKSRTTDPDVLMETLFRHTPLENRFSLNMNVLTQGRIPGVLSLKQVIEAWLEHVHDVLVRRSQHRLDAVLKRLEILNGFLKVYLNLDEVIRIVRDDETPKEGLMKAFSLSELQADYVLNMRLRSLRRLEEMVIRREYEELCKEQASLERLLGSEARRWTRIHRDLEKMEDLFSKGLHGARRTVILDAPAVVDTSAALEVDREPLTAILSRQGWIRAMKGHGLDPTSLRFKEGDGDEFMVECQSTDRLCLMASGGRAFTLKVSDLPRGRGFGQAVRTMVDLSQEEHPIALFVAQEGRKQFLVNSVGRGMIVPHKSLLAEKRTGRQIFNLKEEEQVVTCLFVEGSHVLSLTAHKRVLIFPLEQMPEVNRGSGVVLQKLNGSTIKHIRLFSFEKGLTWREGQRVRARSDIELLLGKRGTTGRVAPQWMLRK